MDREEALNEALDYFEAEKWARPDVCHALGKLRGFMYGWPDGSFATRHRNLVSDFLDGLSYTVLNEDGKFDFTIDARDHKAAIVGKEVAPYV